MNQPTKRPVDPPQDWRKHAALGMGLAGTTLGMAAIGYAIDRFLHHETLVATAFATLVGFAFAMFRFIQNVTQTER